MKTSGHKLIWAVTIFLVSRQLQLLLLIGLVTSVSENTFANIPTTIVDLSTKDGVVKVHLQYGPRDQFTKLYEDDSLKLVAFLEFWFGTKERKGDDTKECKVEDTNERTKERKKERVFTSHQYVPSCALTRPYMLQRTETRHVLVS